MKPATSQLLLCLVALSCTFGLHAASVWSGPIMNFTNLPGSDPSQAVNQDRLTSNVWITRGSLQGIYNAKTETSFAHFLSPADTEWADGTTVNYASLTYTNWDSWVKILHTGPPSTVGLPVVVHLKTDDVYLDAMFTSWGVSGGGFSWQHTTPGTANVPPVVAITSPTNGAVFFAPAVIPITATAQGSGATVTNVSFFDSATLLGATNNPPCTIHSTFAAGSHALAAVATDNFGLSSTSAVVNISVSSILLSFNASGNTLDLSWSVTGLRLQQNQELDTNWVDVPNSTVTNHFIVPIDPTASSTFYRLAAP